MIFCFFCLSVSLFRIKNKRLIVKKNEPLSIYFTGFKSDENPLIYDFSSHNILCENNEICKRKQSIGENLNGDISSKLNFQFNFLKNSESSCLCNHLLQSSDIFYLTKLINHKYYYTFNLQHSMNLNLNQNNENELKISQNNELFNKITFIIKYNLLNKTDQSYEIVSFSAISESRTYQKPEETCLESNEPQLIHENETISLKLLVRFEKTEEKRHISQNGSFVHDYISLMIIFHFGLLILIAYLSFTDFGKISPVPTEERNNDSIWYFLRGDIFRPPQTVHLICSCVGIGLQFVFTLIIIALFGSDLSINQFISRFLTVFSWLGFVSGFSSLKLYRKVGGYEWRSVFTLTLSFVPCFFFIIFALRSFVHFYFDSVGSPTIGAVLRISYLCIVHTVMVSLGMYVSLKISTDGPMFKVNMIPKQIPYQPFYLKPFFKYGISGMYCFANIYKIVSFMYNVIYSDSMYVINTKTLLYFVFLMFLISAEVSIAFVFLQAKNTNFKWWWTSFCCPASVGVAVFIYSLYYFNSFTNFEFTFSSLVIYVSSNLFYCFILSTCCGMFGVLSEFVFLWRVYSSCSL